MTLHAHHRRALTVITAALILDAALGTAYSLVTPHLPLWHGLYCALANAVTVGGDVPPANPGGYAVQAAECSLVVPLFAATFSLFTSGLTGNGLDAAERRLAAHVDRRHRQLTGHVTAAVSPAIPPGDTQPPSAVPPAAGGGKAAGEAAPAARRSPTGPGERM